MMRVRWTVRRSMAAVALSALVMMGVRDGLHPGWHLGIGWGLRAGICRNDADGPNRDDHGLVSGAPLQAGVWLDDAQATMRLGLRLRQGVVVAWCPNGHVIW